MRTRILVAFAAVLCVCHVNGKTTECMEATKAALQYRDSRMKAYPADNVRRVFKTVIKYVNINLYDDQEIEQLVCSIVDADEKTIASIASQRVLVDDAKQLAFVYSSLMFLLNGALIPEYQEEMAKKGEFYDSIGFPDFPLATTDAELSKVISEVDNASLATLFRHYADNSGVQTEGVGFKREELCEALKSADSLEDFVRTSYMNSGDYPDEYDEDLEHRVSNDAQYIRKDVSRAREHYHRVKEEFLQAEMFLRVLDKTGFLGVTRGGPELYSCDFIADTAVEALGYVVEIFGSYMVQSTMTAYLGLDFNVDDTCAVRAWVCSVISSKTQAELMAFLPETASMEIDPKMMYIYMSFTAQEALIDPMFYGGPGMSKIRMVKIADRLNYPVPTDQAKQLAAMLKLFGGHESLDVDAMATILQDASSPEEAFFTNGENYSTTWALGQLGYAIKKFGGKTDTAVKLASCVYQLGMSAEELGLFMLPPN